MKKLMEEQKGKITQKIEGLFGEFNERLNKTEIAIIKNTNDVKNLEKGVSDIKENCQFVEDVFDQKIIEVNENLEMIRIEQGRMQEKLRSLEDRRRRNNIRIDGVQEDEKETKEQIEKNVKDIFKSKLKLKKRILKSKGYTELESQYQINQERSL